MHSGDRRTAVQGMQERGAADSEIQEDRRVIAGFAQPSAQCARCEVGAFPMAEPEGVDDEAFWAVDADGRARLTGSTRTRRTTQAVPGGQPAGA